MKFALLLVTTMIISSASRADVASEFTFGRGNTQSGSLSNSVELFLVKHNETDRYYSFECKKSGFMKKNNLVFQVVDKETKEALIKAEKKVENCKQELRDLYAIAFERRDSADIVLSEKANDKGVFDLTIHYFHIEDVQ